MSIRDFIDDTARSVAFLSRVPMPQRHFIGYDGRLSRAVRTFPLAGVLIVLPAAAPYIFTGLRIGVGLSWLAIIAAEMLIGGVGIGFFIWDAWNSSRLSDIIVALAYIGVTGFVLDKLVALLGNVITRGTAKN